MNILIVTSSYPPEIRSSSHLMQELSEELSSRGYSITVVTSYPKVNLDKIAANTSYALLSKENNINVVRIKTPIHPHQKSNFITRGISYLVLPYIFFRNIKKNIAHNIDLIIVYSPPLTLALVGSMVKKKYRAKFILNVQDIFPQNAIDLGILTNPLLIRLFEKIEKKAYHDADIVTVHSESNRRFITRNNRFAPNKIVTLHNWIDLEEFQTNDKTGIFRKIFPHIRNKFVFFFGGVLGPSQGLDFIIDAARHISHIKEIIILLVGDGLKKERLEEKVKAYQLENVIFHQFVSKSDYHGLLADVHVGLVCLSRKNKTPVVPGKILGYMAAGVPVLAFLNKESDGHQIIREARCGYSEYSDDPQKAAELMLKMYQERNFLKEFGVNGSNYAGKHFSKTVCVNKLETLFR